MVRRRLVVAIGGLALLLPGAAWWVSDDRLSAEEQLLVGRWQLTPYGPSSCDWEFNPDRTCSRRFTSRNGSHFNLPGHDVYFALNGRWAVRDRILVVDEEVSRVRRLLRPICHFLGVKVGPETTFAVSSLAPDKVVLLYKGGPEPWTRAPSD
jgi:hypothetical protein